MSGQIADGQLLRDLDWAISSPLLMRGETENPIAAIGGLPPLAERYSGHRVGYYFESLIGHWLQSGDDIEILASGLQVREGGRTLGELDFVFSDRSGRVRHWEVAVKFYLYCADQQVAGSHFIGPNARDTFERKWDRIQRQQLPLCHRVFPRVDECSAFVKGWIFYQPEQVAPHALPEGMMPDHLRGIWLHHAELAWLEAAGRARGWAFCVLHKPFWLADLILGEADPPPACFASLGAELDRQFADAKHPVMISALRHCGGRWREDERVIVVPDAWPAC